MTHGNKEVLPYMYHLIGVMSDLGYPIVLKGAVLLRVLSEGTGLEPRLTEDIDLDWSETLITNDLLFQRITYALSLLHDATLSLEQHRLFDDQKGAGFIVKRFGRELFRIDIRVHNNIFVTKYVVNNLTFLGSSPTKIVSDKLVVLSSRFLKRRVKDMYDIFVLSSIWDFSLADILNITEHSGNSLGDFSTFLNSVDGKDGLRHAYSKLTGLTTKPSFETVYTACKVFARPLIMGSGPLQNYSWSARKSIWY